jgi:phosphatidate cytidylyltransferase
MLRDRALSAAILVPALVIVLAVGEPWIAIVVAGVVGLGAYEVFRLLRAAGYPSLSLLGVAVAIAVAIGTTALPNLADIAWLLASLGIVLAAVGSFPRADPRDGLATWITTVFGAVYVAQLGFLVRLGREAPAVVETAPLAALGADRGWILLLVLGVWAYDTGAYLIGRRFGRTRFLTKISASKTHAGLVGGLAVTTIVAAGLLWGLGQPPLLGLIVGPLVGLAAQAGDLAESMLKRAAGAKDSSRLIPGHGGILDRIDSFLFAAPALVLYVVAAVR